MRIPLRPMHNGRADQGIGRGFEIVARRDNMSSMVNGEGLDVRIVTSTGADCYALGYFEAEFRRLKFQGEYLRDFTANVLRHAGIAPGGSSGVSARSGRHAPAVVRLSPSWRHDRVPRDGAASHAQRS